MMVDNPTLVKLAYCATAMAMTAIVSYGIVAYKTVARERGDPVEAVKTLQRPTVMALTIALIILSTFGLAITGNMQESAVVAILSGISGFILGTHSHRVAGARQDRLPPPHSPQA
jgi:hypothetical protein